jgi:hypothetical protein
MSWWRQVQRGWRAAALLALVLAVPASPSLAQSEAPASERCERIATQLQRDLARLSRQTAGRPNASTQQPPSAVALLVDLLKIEGLAEHLRCVGTQPDFKRPLR